MQVNAFENHADGIRQVQDYLGDACPSFTWKDQVIRMLPSGAKKRKGVTLGGFQLESDLSFTILRADLPDQLGLKDVITYLEEDYRVDAITRFAGDTLARFDCNNPTQ